MERGGGGVVFYSSMASSASSRRSFSSSISLCLRTDNNNFSLEKELRTKANWIIEDSQDFFFLNTIYMCYHVSILKKKYKNTISIFENQIKLLTKLQQVKSSKPFMTYCDICMVTLNTIFSVDDFGLFIRTFSDECVWFKIKRERVTCFLTESPNDGDLVLHLVLTYQ